MTGEAGLSEKKYRAAAFLRLLNKCGRPFFPQIPLDKRDGLCYTEIETTGRRAPRQGAAEDERLPDPETESRRLDRRSPGRAAPLPMREAYDDRFIRFSHATESVLKAITKYKNDCLDRYGLRGMHLMTMVCLSRSGEGGLTPGDLARLCAVDKAFVSRITGELKRLGYLSVDGGRYNARVSLSERGKAVTAEIYRMLNEAVQRITAGVSASDVETFYAVLERFGENLNVMNHGKGQSAVKDTEDSRADDIPEDGGNGK